MSTPVTPPERQPDRAPARWPWQWAAITALGVLAFALGYVGFRQHALAAGAPRSPLDLLYLTIQLFVLESGSVAGDIPWSLEAARLLAPVVAGWAALRALAVLFRDRLQALRLHRLRDHVVICGAGRKGLQLVSDFRSVGEAVVVIECDQGNDNLAACRDRHAVVLVGNAADPSVLRRAGVARARTLVAVCGADGTNAEIAFQAYHLVRRRPAGAGGTVQCLIHIVNTRLASLLGSHRLLAQTDDPFEARVFNTYQNSARRLFQAYPLDGPGLAAGDPRQVHLVIIGFGQMGQSVALQAARLGRYANGRKLRVTVIDRAAEDRQASFLGEYPQFPTVCDTAFIAADADAAEVRDRIAEWAADDGQHTSLVVCLDDDARCLSYALSIESRLGPCVLPIRVRVSRERGLASLLATQSDAACGVGGGLASFGVIQRACSRTMLLNEELDVLARAIHEDFVRKRRAEGRPATDPSMQDWEHLGYDLKESNRQQADHIPVKLRAIGCTRTQPHAGARPVSTFSEEEVERLARMEHDRWIAERRLAGWTDGPKDNAKRTSPYLGDWADLPDEVRDYDRLAVRGLPALLRLVGEAVYRVGDQAEADPGRE